MNGAHFAVRGRTLVPLLAVLVLGAVRLVAQEPAAPAAGAEHHLWPELLWIPIILLAAKLSSLVERIGQPSVLGELVMGVILGNLVFVGIPFFAPMRESEILRFLAELGVIILLFQIGLESNVAQMRSVGARAMAVAVVGVVVPFGLATWVAGPVLLPGQSTSTYLFLGAALTATSVGITARVFRDLGRLHLPEAQIVLAAAVIDDVLGLIILAVVSALVTAGSVSLTTVTLITGKALLFLVGAVVLGALAAPRLGAFLSRIHAGVAMKVTFALSSALLLAYAAGAMGLAPIVGAFAAGLVLDPLHFKEFETTRHVEELIEPIGHFLVPIFFILTGMAVDLRTLFDVPILLTALGITVVAFAGKIVAGLVAGNVDRWLVGWGMVPRGEVGLIFATIGYGLGVVSDEVYSVIVIMVILTTLFTPPVLTHLLKRHSAGSPAEGEPLPDSA